MTAKDIVKSEPAQRFDIVLDFTCWVHHTRRRWWRRLMFNMRHLEQTAIWEEGDSGGFVLDHKSLLQSAVRQAGLNAVPTANTDIPAPSYLPETFVKKSHIQYVEGLALLGAGLSVVQLLPAFAAGGVTLLLLLGLAPAALAAAMREGRGTCGLYTRT